MNMWTGALMLAIGVFLVIVGRPDKAGMHPKFLRFEAALVFYPALILVFLGLGSAAIFSSLG